MTRRRLPSRRTPSFSSRLGAGADVTGVVAEPAERARLPGSCSQDRWHLGLGVLGRGQRPGTARAASPRLRDADRTGPDPNHRASSPMAALVSMRRSWGGGSRRGPPQPRTHRPAFSARRAPAARTSPSMSFAFPSKSLTPLPTSPKGVLYLPELVDMAGTACASGSDEQGDLRTGLEFSRGLSGGISVFGAERMKECFNRRQDAAFWPSIPSGRNASSPLVTLWGGFLLVP